MEGRTDLIPVWAYTNCPKAELFLNGRSLGVKEVEKYGHAEWQVAFEKGELTVKAYNNDGKEVAEDKKVTSGRSYALKLQLENASDLKANGEDFSMLICPDHPTPISIMTHCSDPVPFVIYRSNDEKESGVMSYTEKTATKTGLSLDNGEQLMKAFLNK
jgi:hypothetical protein